MCFEFPSFLEFSVVVECEDVPIQICLGLCFLRILYYGKVCHHLVCHVFYCLIDFIGAKLVICYIWGLFISSYCNHAWYYKFISKMGQLSLLGNPAACEPLQVLV